ncbi:MAG: glycosyltransferase family 39 protein [Flavobacteriales bacterium]
MSVTDSKGLRWFLFVGFVLLAVLFHSYNLEFASYDLDEAVHIWHAQKSYSDVVEQASNDPNPPVYNLLISAWVKVFGVSEFSTRFLSVMFGSLGVGLMFLIASRNFGLAVGIMAALFYCFSPIQFRFTHLARPYSMLMVTVLLSYGTLLEAIKKPTKRKLFWYYLATTAMIYVHPTSVFNAVAQGLIVLWSKRKELNKIVLLSIPLVAAVLSFGVWVLAIPYFERDDPMWFGPPTWDDIKYVLETFYASKALIATQLALLVLVLIGRTRDGAQKGRNSMLLILVWAIVPFVVSIAFSLFVKPVFQDKYILSVQPAMMLLLAFTIYNLKGKVLPMIGFGVVLTLLLSSMDTTQNPEGNWKKAVEYIKPIHDENSAIFINPWYEFRTFSYYFNRHAFEVPDSTIKILVEEGAFTAWHDVYDKEKGEAKADVVHLFLAHQDFVKGVDMQQLEKNAVLFNQEEFFGITVQSYRCSRSLGFSMLNFDLENDSVFTVDSNMYYSPAAVVKLKNVKNDQSIKISASARIRLEGDSEGVALVVSVEGDENKSFVYRTKNLTETEVNQGWIELSDEFTVDEFETDWIVKAYALNPKGKHFQVDDIKLKVLN